MPGAPAQSEESSGYLCSFGGNTPASLRSVPGTVRPQQEEVGATWQMSQGNLLML